MWKRTKRIVTRDNFFTMGFVFGSLVCVVCKRCLFFYLRCEKNWEPICLFIPTIPIGRKHSTKTYNDNINFIFPIQRANVSDMDGIVWFTFCFIYRMFIPFLSLCAELYQSRFSSKLCILCYSHYTFTERTNVEKSAWSVVCREYFVYLCVWVQCNDDAVSWRQNFRYKRTDKNWVCFCKCVFGGSQSHEASVRGCKCGLCEEERERKISNLLIIKNGGLCPN